MDEATTTVGRYEIHGPIGKGGMATVHLGVLRGPAGFARTVAIKRLRAQDADDPDFVRMLMDEARIAGRVCHPNVITPFDVVIEGNQLLLVMDYVAGEPLARLLGASRRFGLPMPPRIACAIVAAMLHGLHAAHEARGERGEPLGIVHRDVSPQNVVLGADGIARVLDFGIALAEGRSTDTRAGSVKGKVPYMAPEQLRAWPIDRRVDVYAAGVILWEAVAGRRLFDGENDREVMHKVVAGCSTPPSDFAPALDPRVDDAVMRALAVDPDARFATARDMARVLEDIGVAASAEIGDWVESLAGPRLARRAEQIAQIERRTSVAMPLAPPREASTPPPTRVDTAPPIVIAPSAMPPRRHHVLLGLLAASTLCAATLAFHTARSRAAAASEPVVPEAATSVREQVSRSEVGVTPMLVTPPEPSVALHARDAAPPSHSVTRSR